MSIAVLISGRGSNLRAILDAELPVSLVVSNRRDAPGLQYAKVRGIKTEIVADADYPTRAEADKQLMDCLERASPMFIALAGFMRVLGADIVHAFDGRMVNIHPSLLPKFRGLNTHMRKLDMRERWHQGLYDISRASASGLVGGHDGYTGLYDNAKLGEWSYPPLFLGCEQTSPGWAPSPLLPKPEPSLLGCMSSRSIGEHGCTVHWVSEGVDEGDIIAQSKVQVLDGDNAETLAERVLKAEHVLYPRTLEDLLDGVVRPKARNMSFSLNY